MLNFLDVLIRFISAFVNIPTELQVNIIPVNNNNTVMISSGAQVPIRLIGQSPGFIIEEYIGSIFDSNFSTWFNQNYPNYALMNQNGIIHQPLSSTFDFSFEIKDLSTNEINFYSVDSKAEKNARNIRSTVNQRNHRNDNNAFLIYSRYQFVDNNNPIDFSINQISVMTFTQAYNNRVLRDSVEYSFNDNLSEFFKVEFLNISSNTVKVDLSDRTNSLNETIKYLEDPNTLFEAKKRVQLKKFIEENFNKKGEYISPKDGNSKCTLHPEYDKSLLRFFAEHGITRIMSAYGKNVPSLGYSASEEKWYGWSHRAIYGFGVGDKIKKGTCGYEKIKEKGLLNIKSLDQAKEVAKIFAEDVA